MVRDLAYQLAAEGFPFRCAIRGFSMWPSLCDGQRILVCPWHGPFQELVGKIIAFRIPNGRVLVHRAARVEKGLIYAKGDALATGDEPIPFTQFIGVVHSEYEGLRVRLRRIRRRFYLFLRALPRIRQRRHTFPR
jgi:hypothetical protein